MADGSNDSGWETKVSKGDKKKAREAQAERNAQIKQMRELVKKIFNSGSPSQYQDVKMRTIDLLKAMGENVSEFERREEEKLARERAEAEKAARNREIAAQMSKNKDKAQRHYGQRADFEFRQIKSLMTTRLMGQTMIPSNAEVYSELARRVDRKIAQGGPPPRAPSPPRRAPPPPVAPAVSNILNANYALLGINPSAKNDEISSAFRRMSLKTHPNKNKTPGANERFKALSVAHDRIKASRGLGGGKRKTRRANKSKRRS